MKRNLFFIKFGGYVFVSALGTLFHFLYEWTNESVIFAPFTAVNESIFEHMKLLYFPYLFWSIIENKILNNEYKNYWCAKAKSITLGLLLIPTLYYTYTGALGVYADWFNILIFFISGAVTFIFDTKFLQKNNNCRFPKKVYLIYFLTLGAVLIVFTFLPFEIPLFLDKQSKNYGI